MDEAFDVSKFLSCYSITLCHKRKYLECQTSPVSEFVMSILIYTLVMLLPRVTPFIRPWT